jgi:dimeric dUTPase (all-alpha-NTP-PPase superfamily)
MTITEWFELQHELQRDCFDVDVDDFSPDERAAYIRWNALALIVEVTELLNESGWKPWSSKQFVNSDRALSEFVDVMHFLANLGLAMGVQPNDVGAAYVAKQAENRQRQQEGY